MRWAGTLISCQAVGVLISNFTQSNMLFNIYNNPQISTLLTRHHQTFPLWPWGPCIFLQASSFLPSSPWTLASLWPLIADPLIPICIFLTYVGGIQGLNMRPSIVFPLTKGVSHILFSFNGVFRLHIWPREFQIFLFCNVWCLYQHAYPKGL